MALAERALRNGPKGHARPRLAPPLPARSQWREVHEEAARTGIELMPWQDTANRYINALGSGDRWLYPEVLVLVARQNGKTELLVPHIERRLVMGRRIMHTAQNRELPREVFGRVVDVMERYHRDLLAKKPRFANGQEEIRTKKGGLYRIVAPTRGGARGPSNDDLIIDEVRELVTHDFIAAGKPTLNASANPQVLYLSNEGDEESEVLNALKKRADEDTALALLSWSAAPERSHDDRVGWLEANPAAGHLPRVMENLEREHRSHLLAGTLAIWETEHLCRHTISMAPRLVALPSWERCAMPNDPPRRAFMAVSSDPSGNRASAAVAWQRVDGRIGLRVLADVTGSPIDTDALGRDLKPAAAKLGVTKVAYDPWTDTALARHFRGAVAVNGRDFANATKTFVELVEGGRIAWDEADAVSADLPYTTRKDQGPGAFMAVKAKDDRPITASLAAVRAVWLASVPAPSGVARIY